MAIINIQFQVPDSVVLAILSRATPVKAAPAKPATKKPKVRTAEDVKKFMDGLKRDGSPKAPYGLKKDGTPKKRPGRPVK